MRSHHSDCYDKSSPVPQSDMEIKEMEITVFIHDLGQVKLGNYAQDADGDLIPQGEDSEAGNQAGGTCNPAAREPGSFDPPSLDSFGISAPSSDARILRRSGSRRFPPPERCGALVRRKKRALTASTSSKPSKEVDARHVFLEREAAHK
jgi:hypothetical protein